MGHATVGKLVDGGADLKRVLCTLQSLLEMNFQLGNMS